MIRIRILNDSGQVQVLRFWTRRGASSVLEAIASDANAAGYHVLVERENELVVRITTNEPYRAEVCHAA